LNWFLERRRLERPHSQFVGMRGSNMQLDDTEIDQLRAGAECRIHYHPKDFPDINDLINLEAVNPGIVVSTDTQLSNTQTLVPADTSGGNITLTLPPPADGREYQIIKTSALNTYSPCDKLACTSSAWPVEPPRSSPNAPPCAISSHIQEPPSA